MRGSHVYSSLSMDIREAIEQFHRAVISDERDPSPERRDATIAARDALLAAFTPAEPPQQEINMIDKRSTGLYAKFTVTRTDGKSAPGEKHDGCEYFVLDVTHDKHAHAALKAYADSCEGEYPLLARDVCIQAQTQILSGLVAPAEPQTPLDEDAASQCHAGRDGDCIWPGCPQRTDYQSVYPLSKLAAEPQTPEPEKQECPRCHQRVETMTCLKNHKAGESWCPDSGRNMDAYALINAQPAAPVSSDALRRRKGSAMPHIPDPLEIKLIAFRDELFYLSKQEQCIDESSLQRATAFERAARIVMQYIPLVCEAAK